jgi:hypothetical protein
MFLGPRLPDCLLLFFVLGASAADVPDSLRITILSSRPELVSGGDALVRVDPIRENLQVRLNGVDVTSLFRPAKDGFGSIALLTGLRLGSNELLATAGPARASLNLVNYPITGPLISGPHEQPFLCETERFKLPSGQTLGEPLDDSCSITTRVDYFYRTAGSEPLIPLIFTTPFL